MEVLKGYLLWPLVTLFGYIRFLVGIILCFPYLLRYYLQGKRSFRYIDVWNLLNRCYLGTYVFSAYAVFVNPFSGCINPLVTSFRISHCEASIHDYPWLRNTYNCIHAAVIANLGEFASSMCMLSTLQTYRHLQGIPVGMEMEYYKHARGPLTVKAVAVLEV